MVKVKNPKRVVLKAQITANKQICPGYWEMAVRSPEIARVSCSGQFCLLTAPGVFLRRPFSIYYTEKDTVYFLYKIIGEGTKNLSELKPGEKITVMGPLGSGYDTEVCENKTPLLIAGGTGVASLNFLAKSLCKKGILFYGARTKKELVCLDGYKKAGFEIKVATEDGSSGIKGFVTDVFKKYVNLFTRYPSPFTKIVYSCGPHPMLEKVAKICLENKIKCYVSMEEMMACGVGNCQGCAVPVKSGGYKMACKDGPVFAAEDLIWK